MYKHLLNEIDKLLWLQFPKESASTDAIIWQLEPFRSTWFQLATRAVGIVDSATLSKHIREDWFPQRKHAIRKSHRLNLDKLVEAWHEWQFAVTSLARSPEYRNGVISATDVEMSPEIRVYPESPQSSETSVSNNELCAIKAENARLKILLAETILEQARAKNPRALSS